VGVIGLIGPRPIKLIGQIIARFIENGGSYICGKTTLEVERVLNQLIRWSLSTPGKKVKKG
jgi:hypothetical protein